MKLFSIMLGSLLGLVFTIACEDRVATSHYDKNKIISTKRCPEILFHCLDESVNGYQVSQFKELTIMSEKDTLRLNASQEEKLKAIQKLHIHQEITEMLELFYPGFWGDTPQEERLQWIKQVETKSKEYGFVHSRGQLEAMAHICAILGVNFDQKSEHDPIVQFLKNEAYCDTCRLTDAINYLYFVYLEREFDMDGDHLNTWSLRDALKALPKPKRHVPSFNTEHKPYNQEYDLQKKYFDTIREGGKA